MPTVEQLRRWHEVLFRLVDGPAPRGVEFDFCRRVVREAPTTPEAAAAARMLLEGAMADDLTDVADTPEVMAILRAAGHGRLDFADLMDPP